MSGGGRAAQRSTCAGVRLPADRRTPAAARALVRSVLAEADLDELLNEALLLTTELSTNAVVHAGTELDIEVAADPDGLTVTVTDFAGGPIETVVAPPGNDTSDISQVSERGRGLLLVDHFASRWGTIHDADRKGVWFRLDRPGAAPAPVPPDRCRPRRWPPIAAGRRRPGAQRRRDGRAQPDRARPVRRRRRCPTSPPACSPGSPRWSARPAAWCGSTAATAPGRRCWPGTAARPAPATTCSGCRWRSTGRTRASWSWTPRPRRTPSRSRRWSPSGSRCTWRTTGCAGPTCAGRAG